MTAATSAVRVTPRPALWVGYLVLGATAIIASQLNPTLPLLPGWRSHTAIYLFINASSVVALAIGVARHRPAHRAAWLFVLANQMVYLAGDFLFYVGRSGWGWTVFPQPADAFYLGHYPLLITGLVLMLRTDSAHTRRRLADGLIAGVGFGVLSWVMLIAPTAALPGTLLVRLTSVSYPVLDLTLFLIALQLLFGSWRRVRSFHILVTALILLFVNDSVYSWLQLHGTYHGQRILDIIWMTYYVLLGASALHPSMRELTQGSTREADPHWRQLVLAVLTLMTPTVGLVQAATGAASVEIPVAIGSIVVFVLVGARMLGLIAYRGALLADNARQARELETTVAQLRAAECDRTALLGQAVDAAERARTHLAADIHDGPIQQLASLAYTIDRATLQMNAGDVEACTNSMATVRTGLNAEIAYLRRMMTELRPPILDHGGLVPAIEQHATAFESRTGIAVDFAAEPVAELLESEAETALYRVYQESLANVARHAHSTSVQVTLTVDAAAVLLTIVDGGRGFDTTRRPGFLAEGHFGLAGMQERIEVAGGTWRLESKPGCGTLIIAAMPFSAAAGERRPEQQLSATHARAAS